MSAVIRFFRNPYNQLLGSLVALIISSPLIVRVDAEVPVLAAVYSLIVICSLRIICVRGRLFWFVTGVAALGIFLEVMMVLKVLDDRWFLWPVCTDISFAVFTLFAICALMRKIFSEKRVTIDTITGSIAVYLMIGILWIFLYYLAGLFSPTALSGAIGDRVTRSGDIFYFSFTTMTTLGYGDLVPTDHLSRMLASLEAVTGQIFLTVFVARLVGLHIVHETSKRA